MVNFDFKRMDRHTGSRQNVFHKCDGTSSVMGKVSRIRWLHPPPESHRVLQETWKVSRDRTRVSDGRGGLGCAGTWSAAMGLRASPPFATGWDRHKGYVVESARYLYRARIRTAAQGTRSSCEGHLFGCMQRGPCACCLEVWEGGMKGESSTHPSRRPMTCHS